MYLISPIKNKPSLCFSIQRMELVSWIFVYVLVELWESGSIGAGGSLTSYVCFDVFSNEWTICPYCMLPVWVKKDVPVSKSHTSSGPQHESCALEYIMTHSIQKQLRSLHNITHQTQNNYIFKHYYCIFLLAVSLFRFLLTQRVIESSCKQFHLNLR